MSGITGTAGLWDLMFGGVDQVSASESDFHFSRKSTMQNPYQNRGGFSERGQMGYSGLFWPVLACFGPGKRSSAHKKPRERSSAHKQPRERSSAHKKPRERNYAPARSCFGQSGSSNAQWLHIEHWFTWDKLTPHAGPGVDPDRGRSELVRVSLHAPPERFKHVV